METIDKKSAISPEEWLRIIEECKASDLPVTEYCAQTGVGVSHYYRWRRRLHGKSAQSKGSKGVGAFTELSAIPVDDTWMKVGVSSPGKMHKGHFWPIYGDRDEIIFPFRL